MHLLVDGYNLLHVGRTSASVSPTELQRERDELVRQLASYRQTKPCEITVIFDGWQGGWSTEKRERVRGMELIFSRLGERADEVIKRMAKEKGSGAVVVTSDREIARYAEKISVSVVPSALFRERLDRAILNIEKDAGWSPQEGRESDKKGPSRRLSKKERKTRAALKKL